MRFCDLKLSGPYLYLWAVIFVSECYAVAKSYGPKIRVTASIRDTGTTPAPYYVYSFQGTYDLEKLLSAFVFGESRVFE